MEKSTSRKLLIIISFYGALWGLSEAVLGYVLHMLPPGIQGFIMFPVGFYFMNSAYRKTQKPVSIFLVGAVAAGIKLFDLFLPAVPVIRTVNPTVCILFEALMVFAVYKAFSPGWKGFPIAAAILPSLAWRVLYILLTYIQTFFGLPSGIINGGWGSIASFVFIEGIANSAVIFIYIMIERAVIRRRGAGKAGIRPVFSACALALALGATLALPLL